jgi:NO-binding membrane sensor protein with MHYT domain
MTALGLGGGGIWSMHFVGMAAYHLDSTVRFDLRLTMLSLVVAVAATGPGSWLAAANPSSAGRLAAGGASAGLATGATHYLGMAAQQTARTIIYDRTLVLLSVVVAMVATTTAFWLTFHLGGIRRILGASLVTGAAICGAHHATMSVTRVTADPLGSRPIGFDPLAFGMLTAFGATIVMMFIIVVALDRVAEPESNIRRSPANPPVVSITPARSGAGIRPVATVDRRHRPDPPDILSWGRDEHTVPLRIRPGGRAPVGRTRPERREPAIATAARRGRRTSQGMPVQSRSRHRRPPATAASATGGGRVRPARRAAGAARGHRHVLIPAGRTGVLDRDRGGAYAPR